MTAPVVTMRQPTANAAVLTVRPVIVGPGASEVRREIGAVAWVVLEQLCATAVHDPDLEDLVVATSTRALAGSLGFSKDTAARALHVLREAGLVCAMPVRGAGGRFDSPRYLITTPHDVLRPQTISARTTRTTPPTPTPPPVPVAIAPVLPTPAEPDTEVPTGQLTFLGDA